MIDHAQRVEGIVKGALKLAAGGEPFGWSVSQTFAPVPQQDGKPGPIIPAWMVTVTIRSPLVGKPDIGRMYPVPGVLPDEETLRKVATELLRQCKAEAAEQVKPPEPKSAGQKRRLVAA